MEGKQEIHLILGYKADAGWRSALLESTRKIFGLRDGGCSLCALTHGVFRENKEWRRYREHCGWRMTFLHGDELMAHYPVVFETSVALPVILIALQGEVRVLLSAEELRGLRNPESLIRAVQDRLEVMGKVSTEKCTS